MAKHEAFKFADLDALRRKVAELGVDVPLSEDLSPLSRPVKVGAVSAPNAFCCLPMEGCDSEPDGSPSELVARRYHRLLSGGAGLVWWEACAVTPEGRANELQMMLTRDNAEKFAALLDDTRRAAHERNGWQPLCVLQLTHSGRYSRPHGHTPTPLVPQRDPLLDARSGVVSDAQVVSDDYLESLIEKYVASALLAQQCGFDGVDIKSCHRYLLSELLAARERPGKYGGSFENRSRLLLEIVRAVRAATGPDFIIACRFNAYDAHPYPYGFGVNCDDLWQPDTDEPVRLTKALCAASVGLLTNSAGNPYFNYQYVTRPYDSTFGNQPAPSEHPLESAARLFALTEAIQHAAGPVPVAGSGYTWLRQYLPNAGAANIAAGRCSFVGLGRSSFAYPDAPRDVLLGSGMDPKKCCITCSKCTEIMRCHGRTGCVVRDAQVYAPLYRQYLAEAQERAAADK